MYHTVRDTETRSPQFTSKVIDGSAFVHTTQPEKGMTFDEYSLLFVNKIKKIISCEKLQRLDIVFDRYFSPSIKGEAREKRGHGLAISVRGSSQVPKNWQNFLSVGKNKEQLYSMLANEVKKISDDSLVIATLCEGMVSNNPIDSTILSPCNHEEADMRIFLHVKHISSYSTEERRICICVTDTDVVIIAISVFDQLGCTELWIEFGIVSNKLWLPIHHYVS